jgi:hypothetical protein
VTWFAVDNAGNAEVRHTSVVRLDKALLRSPGSPPRVVRSGPRTRRS